MNNKWVFKNDCISVLLEHSLIVPSPASSRDMLLSAFRNAVKVNQSIAIHKSNCYPLYAYGRALSDWPPWTPAEPRGARCVCACAHQRRHCALTFDGDISHALEEGRACGWQCDITGCQLIFILSLNFVLLEKLLHPTLSLIELYRCIYEMI